jgi:hypothetical protein
VSRSPVCVCFFFFFFVACVFFLRSEVREKEKLGMAPVVEIIFSRGFNCFARRTRVY